MICVFKNTWRPSIYVWTTSPVFPSTSICWHFKRGGVYRGEVEDYKCVVCVCLTGSPLHLQLAAGVQVLRAPPPHPGGGGHHPHVGGLPVATPLGLHGVSRASPRRPRRSYPLEAPSTSWLEEAGGNRKLFFQQGSRCDVQVVWHSSSRSICLDGRWWWRWWRDIMERSWPSVYIFCNHRKLFNDIKFLKCPVCKSNEAVQGLHGGFYSTNLFKSPVSEQVVVEVKTWERPDSLCCRTAFGWFLLYLSRMLWEKWTKWHVNVDNKKKKIHFIA